MNDLKDLEVIYLSLEESAVLRDIGDSWGEEDLSEWGITFEQLLELRDFVLAQDFSINLGFTKLVDSIFNDECRELLSREDASIWSSVKQNLEFTSFSLAMSALISGDFQTIKESILDDFILSEIDGMESDNELKKRIRENFKLWKSSDAPKELVKELPKLGKVELAKLRELRG